ncbi:MAG: riboflavin biosynthesis protein RibF [Bacteroidales bacterium]
MIVTTGFFDGVHLGHRALIRQLVEKSSSIGEESMIVTFWPHPRNVLQDDARNLRLLSTLEEKKRMLSDLGVDDVRILNFTKEFSRLSTKEYLSDYVMGQFGATGLLLGYDNRIGSSPSSPDETASVARGLGLKVMIADSVSAPGDGVISSTKIREALSRGDVVQANSMLGYNYCLFGVVVSGNQLGRTMGFPTANMQLYEPLKLVPENGVYAVEVETLGEKYHGMCNIGVRPTVGNDNALTIETNIFDFDKDIYGLDIKISFVERIRQECRFSGLNALQAQLCRDKRACISIFG